MIFFKNIKIKIFSLKYSKFIFFFLTNNALKQLNKLSFNDIFLGIRINIKKSGCVGFIYYLEKVYKLEKNDIFFKNKYVKLLFSYKVISFLDGTKLDYIKDGLNYSFKFYNVKARNVCGCGNSFELN